MLMHVVQELTELRSLDLFKGLITGDDPIYEQSLKFLLIPWFLNIWNMLLIYKIIEPEARYTPVFPGRMYQEFAETS